MTVDYNAQYVAPVPVLHMLFVLHVLAVFTPQVGQEAFSVSMRLFSAPAT